MPTNLIIKPLEASHLDHGVKGLIRIKKRSVTLDNAGFFSS